MLVVKIWVIIVIIDITYTVVMKNYYKNNIQAAINIWYDDLVNEKIHISVWISAILNIFSIIGLLYTLIYFLFH